MVQACGRIVALGLDYLEYPRLPVELGQQLSRVFLVVFGPSPTGSSPTFSVHSFGQIVHVISS